ncbi:transposase [Streptomyces sp. NPDC102283]|uniref:IS701 family transposase n=1 Tax=Streptomyces sp. NPDC102283 TaxID=3366155 RepID=UPI0037F4EF70
MEPRCRARAFVLGLLSELPRKNCWTLAEHVGDANPHGPQHLLSLAKRDADAVRNDIRGFTVEHLHDTAAVLVIDEAGDLKKGTNTVGVQRQYTGTAGRIENSQVAVYLAHSTRRGHAAIDRELYVPPFLDRGHGPLPGRRDPRHRRPSSTKPALAARMIGASPRPG